MRRPQTGNTHKLSGLIGIALMALAGQAAGFDLDSNSPIKVTADNARLDESKGTAIYTGDVIVSQDATELTAQKVVLYRNKGVLDRIEAFGEPAHYSQARQGETPKTDAEALTIIYAAGDSRITFEKQAIIRQEGNVFKGDHIEYNTASRVVVADGGRSPDNPDGRVEMLIQPRQSNENQGETN
ncbi:lipopolysaccharide transport periplasmic protein LptA [Marinobacter fonticola]|uniref:lipopolysaccharide transport periplasmic protein LptA n=1 Tax=Marinobacter fonticola TaxID=2603215 RepID=UPI0011E6DB63|nr:lipopolysaccharide transport periplasmic protein LptA [Marinobacter fonticola]